HKRSISAFLKVMQFFPYHGSRKRRLQPLPLRGAPWQAKAGAFAYAATACRRCRVALPRDRRYTREQKIQDRVAQHNSKGKFPDVQRRSRGSATLPRHARGYADTFPGYVLFGQVPV